MISKTKLFSLRYNWEQKTLALILLVGLIVRFFMPFIIPPSLNWDETSLGYNAYSILKTGKDEWGRILPLSFEAFGDYKLPGYVYATVPSVLVFGLNDWAIRFPSRIFGLATILFLYLLVKKITGDKIWALLSVFLLAISPWHLFLSRVALEANLALGLLIIGIYFFVRGLEKQWYFILSSIILGITLFTYNSARVFVPLIVLSLAILYFPNLKYQKKHLALPIIILGVFLALATIYGLFYDSNSRYYWVSIVDQGAINYLGEARSSSSLPSLAAILIYNRYTYFAQHALLNYLSYFSPEFLFVKGASNYQFSVPGTGMMYLIEMPFLIFGFLNILRRKSQLLFLLWLLLAPIPAAITREAPHALRSIFMLGALQVITAQGIMTVFSFLKYKKYFKLFFSFGVMLLLIASFFTYLYQYFLVYPQGYSQAWQYGMKEAITIVSQYQQKYRHKPVYFTKRYGEPHIFYLFYSQYDPAKYQSNPTLVRYARTNWRWVDRLDNIYFINDWEVKNKVTGVQNALLITSPNNYPVNSQVIDSIYFLDGSKAFDVVEL